MVFLLQIDMRGTDPNSWHLKELYDGDDFPFIVENGELVLGTPPERYTDILIDFTHPFAQKIIVNQVIAVAESGLWDGIFFDFWNEKGVRSWRASDLRRRTTRAYRDPERYPCWCP